MEKVKKPFFKRKGGIIFIVIMVVLIASAIAGFALRNQILRGVLGPAKYYLFKEGLTIYDLGEEDFGLEGTLALGEDYSSIMVWTGAEQSKIDLNVQWSNTEDKRKFDINFLGFIDIDIKSQGNLMSFCINNGDTTVATTEKKKSANKTATKKKETKEMSGWDKIVWLYDFMNSPIINEIEDNCVTTSEQEYNGITCTVDTYTFSGKNQSVILNSLADKLENEEDSQYIYKTQVASVLKNVGLISSSDPDEMAKTLRNKAKECAVDNEILKYCVYYDGGEIVNREYSSSETSLKLGVYNKDKDKYINFGYNSITGDFKVTDSPDVSDVNINGKDAKPMDEIMGDLTGLFGDMLFNTND